MAKRPLPDQATLDQLLRYDPETGELFWRERPAHLFHTQRQSAEHCAAKWNSRYADQPAMTGLNGNGYRNGGLLGRFYLTHRIIWKLVYGTEPDEIDHENGNRADNKLLNLRDVSHGDNGRNAKLQSRNSSGVCGVSWHEASGKWIARIRAHGANRYLGVFEDFDRAVAARKQAEIEYGFHPNHGRR